MRRVASFALIGLVPGLLISTSCRQRADDHCGNNGGDADCGEGFCNVCELASNGCVDELDDIPPDCHYAGPDATGSGAGTGTGSGGDDGSDDGSDDDGGSSGTGGSDGGSDTGTTTPPPECTAPDGTVDGACSAPAKFCVGGSCVDCTGAPASACADADAVLPACNAATGECVQCTPTDANACAGTTPVCDAPSNTCRACEWHAECAGTACHLDGPSQGGCFESSEVVWVDSSNGCPGAGSQADPFCTISDAISSVANNGVAVVVVQGGSDYAERVAITNNKEIALLGKNDAAIVGGNLDESVTAAGSSLVYLSEIAITGNNQAEGINCSSATLWVDDSTIRNNNLSGIAAPSNCALHVRRSIVRANLGGGLDLNGGSLDMENTAVSLNGGLSATNPGIRANATTLNIVYSTIAGNQQSGSEHTLLCQGATSGSIRNSILSGAATNSISGCGGVTFENNAVDTGGLGASNQDVGSYSAGWFLDPAAGDFHLANPAPALLRDIAMWASGDPEVDIDGDARPMGAAGYPGIDEP